MEIKTISYTLRKNLGNYEHEELAASATLKEGEEEFKAMLHLKSLVHMALNGESTIYSGKSLVQEVLEKMETGSEVEGDVPPQIPKEAQEEKPKRTRTTKAKETPKEEMEEVTSPFKDIPAEEEAPKATKPPKGTVMYDKEVKEHRSRLATYLGTHHAGWQTKRGKDEIAKFSHGLHGKPFEDAKGNMLDSFKAELAEFFG